jgi:hypothetical protein
VKRWWESGIPLWIVEIALFLVLLLAIGQPALLRVFHVHQGEDLKVADVISILATVVSIIAASSGILVYLLARGTLEATNKSFVYQAGLPSAHLSTVLALGQLEPLLADRFSDPLTDDDELRKSSCLRAIQLAKDANGYAQLCLDRAGLDIEMKTSWQDTLWTTRAYVLACDVYVRRAPPSDQAAQGAVKLLSKVKNVSDEESQAWALLCCHPQASPEWRNAETLARRVVDRRDTLMRRRYEVAFGDHFLD